MPRSALLETLVAGSAIRGAHALPQPGLRRHCHPDARARDRRQRRHLQRAQRRAAAAAAVAEPDRAVMIWSKWTAFDKTWVAEGEVVDYRRRSRTLQEVATWSDGQVNLTGDQEPERVAGARVSANTFSTLGVAPMIGRTFTAQEDLPNGPRLVVLGYGLWNRRYSADSSLVGRSILINGDVVRSRGHHAAGLRSADGLSQSRTDPAVDAAADEPGRYRSRKPRPLRRRQAEARRDGAAGSRRAERDRPRHDERRALSGSDAVRHGRALARRRGCRFRPALHLAALRCGGLPAAHRLRQRRQPAARARGGAATRDGRALGARGQPDPDGAPAPDREPRS